MKVKCDDCSNKFEMKKDIKTINKEGRKIKISEFSCPQCNKTYKSVLFDKKLKKKIKRRGEMIERASTENDKNKLQELLEKTKKLKTEIKEEHSKLKLMIN